MLDANIIGKSEGRTTMGALNFLNIGNYCVVNELELTVRTLNMTVLM